MVELRRIDGEREVGGIARIVDMRHPQAVYHRLHPHRDATGELERELVRVQLLPRLLLLPPTLGRPFRIPRRDAVDDGIAAVERDRPVVHGLKRGDRLLLRHRGHPEALTVLIEDDGRVDNVQIGLGGVFGRDRETRVVGLDLLQELAVALRHHRAAARRMRMGRAPALADDRAPSADLVEVDARKTALPQLAHKPAHVRLEVLRRAAHRRETARYVDVVLPAARSAGRAHNGLARALLLPLRPLHVPADSVHVGLHEDALVHEPAHGGDEPLLALARRPEERIARVIRNGVPPVPVECHGKPGQLLETLNRRRDLVREAPVPEPDGDVAQLVLPTRERDPRPRLFPGPATVDVRGREPVSPECADRAAERHLAGDAVPIGELRRIVEEHRQRVRLRPVAHEEAVHVQTRVTALVHVPGLARAVEGRHEVYPVNPILAHVRAAFCLLPVGAANHAAVAGKEQLRRVRARNGNGGEPDVPYVESRFVSCVPEGIRPAVILRRRRQFGRDGEAVAAERMPAPHERCPAVLFVNPERLHFRGCHLALWAVRDSLAQGQLETDLRQRRHGHGGGHKDATRGTCEACESNS